MCTRLCTSQLRIKGILDWPEEFIPGYRGHIVAHSFSHRVLRAVGRTIVPSTFAPTETLQSHTESGSAHQTGSVSNIEEDVRASIITDQSEDIHTDTMYGIYKMRNAYYPRTLNVALTLRDFALTQW